MMTLLELLIKKLPQCAGWPKDAARCIYHEHKEGATFYDVEGAMVKNGVGFIDLCIPDVRREEVTREQYEAALAASKPEWDGEGLPPEGCNFEYMASPGRWFIAKMKYCGKSFAIVDIDGSESWMSLNQAMRPVRSEVDKKKEAAIFAIADLCRESASNGHLAELIYDAIKSGKIVID
ncbi:hypothetical protein ACVCE8_001390 [Enterobacter hormaechei]